jgi:NAD(P)-dependent dehydrogenase (short-subunit alcohol dehydrogenase family)
MKLARPRVALVTGAASGLGRLAAQRLLDAGAAVAALDRDEVGLRGLVPSRGTLRTFACDVTDHPRVRAIADEVEETLGPIDRVMHAAGIMPGAQLLDEDPARTAQCMRVNYEGTVHVTHATLPRMLARGRGDFIVFGSVAGEALTPRLGAYCASKAAVNAYVEVLAHENAGKGVRIHLACPPMVDTPLLKQSLEGAGPRSLHTAVERKMLASPGDVLDAIEAAIDRGDVVSHPIAMSKWLHAMRRVAPGVLWRIIERAES